MPTPSAPIPLTAAEQQQLGIAWTTAHYLHGSTTIAGVFGSCGTWAVRRGPLGPALTQEEVQYELAPCRHDRDERATSVPSAHDLQRSHMTKVTHSVRYETQTSSVTTLPR